MQPRCRWMALCTFLTLISCPPAHGDSGKNEPARVDRHGDSLPEGAVARLGTVRFRHGGGIEAGVFAPDGKTLTTYGSDEMIRTWDVPSGRQVREVARCGHRPEWVNSAAFSANGKLLALGCGERNDNDKLVLLCDATSGCELRRFAIKVIDWAIWSVAFSPDGQILAAGDCDGKITAWNTTSGKQLYSSKWEPYLVAGLAFSPDGTVLASGNGVDGLALWDAHRGWQLEEIMERGPGHVGKNSFRSHMTFTPDGKMFASANSDSAIRLWDVHTFEEQMCLRPDMGKDNELTGLTISPDGTTLAAETYDGAVYLWDLKTGQKRFRIELGKRRLGGWPDQSLLFAPDGKTLATWGRENAVRLWDVQSGKELNALDGHRRSLHVVAFSPDGRSLATGGDGVVVRLWEAQTGNWLRDMTASDDWEIRALAFSPDGETLACAGDYYSIRLFSMSEGKPWRTLKTKEPANAVTFTPDGRTLISTNSETTLWDWRIGKEERQLEGRAGARGLCLSHDGRLLVTAWNGIHLWNLTTGKEQLSIDLEGEQGYRGVALLPDGRSLLALRHDGMLRWLEVASGRERRHWEGAKAFAVSADGSLVVSGGDDGDVHIWELATGKLLKRLSGHRGPVLGLALSPDNHLLASAGADTTVLVWDFARLRSTPKPKTDQLSVQRLEQLWNDLDGEPAVAAVALGVLRESPEQAVALFQKRLLPVSGDTAHRGRLIAALDAEEFATRQAAFRELALFGEAAVPALRDARGKTKSAELRRQVDALLDKTTAPEAIAADERVCRALEVLEACGTVEAKRLLETLAKGEPKAWLTREAKATLDHLDNQAILR